MSTQISFEIDLDTMVLFCGDCCRRVKIHYLGRRRAFQRYVHVECHGVHRIVSISEYATRVAELGHRDARGNPIFAALWEQLYDALSSERYEDWARDVDDEIRRCSDIPPDRADPREVAEHVDGLRGLARAIAAVIANRAARRSDA